MSFNDDDFGFRSRSINKPESDQFGFMERSHAHKKEDVLKSGARTAYQPVGGFLKKFTYPLDLLEMGGKGYALDPDEIEHLRKIYEREGIPFDEEEYRNQVEQASQYFPTQGNIEREIEEQTGIPLEAKNELQKALRMGSTAASFQPGAITQKGAAAITAPAGKKILDELGVPETLSELAGYGIGGGAGIITPAASISKVTKPSGLTSRRFEKIDKPTKISAGRYKKINEKLETEFKHIADEIFENSPAFEEIKADPVAYTEKLNQGFDQVEKLASEIGESITQKKLTTKLAKRSVARRQGTKGIIPSESEATFRTEFGNLIKKTAKNKKPFSTQQLVDQFRKNNKELAEYFEPGKSKAFNKGKRDALLEYNSAIEDVFEDLFPNSEFNKLFQEQNQNWSRLKDYDFVQDQLAKIFENDKINFKDISKILDKRNANFRRPFERTLGNEGFKQFEQLVKDLKSIENPYSLLKRAENAGFGDLAKTAGQFILHPSLGKLKVAKGLANDAFKSLLDKPQLSLIWKKGIDSLKKGDYQYAQNMFEQLKKEIY